jgi:hypothetical protein
LAETASIAHAKLGAKTKLDAAVHYNMRGIYSRREFTRQNRSKRHIDRHAWHVVPPTQAFRHAVFYAEILFLEMDFSRRHASAKHFLLPGRRRMAQAATAEVSASRS